MLAAYLGGSSGYVVCVFFFTLMLQVVDLLIWVAGVSHPVSFQPTVSSNYFPLTY